MSKLRIMLLAVVLMLVVVPGYALDWKKLHEEAKHTHLWDAEDYVKRNADSLDGLYILGLVNLSQDKDEEAEAAFIRLLEMEPATFEAEWALAEILHRQGKLEESQKTLTTIIREHPDFSPAYVSLSYIKFALADYAETARLATLVLRQEGDLVDVDSYVRANLMFAAAQGMIAHQGGPLVRIIHGAEVLPSIKKIKRIIPKSAMIYFGLGAFYLLTPASAGGEMYKAERHFHKAIDLDRNLADAYAHLAQLYKYKGNQHKSDKYLRVALRIDPANRVACDIKAKAGEFSYWESKD